MSRNIIILVMYIKTSDDKLVYFIKRDPRLYRFYELKHLFIGGVFV